MEKQLLTAGFILFSLILPIKAFAASFTQIYAFDDSLTDLAMSYLVFTPI